MKEDKKEVEIKGNKIKYIIPIIILIISILIFMFVKDKKDKDYEIEEIAQFSYLKLYEDNKYGVIDDKRKYFN